MHHRVRVTRLNFQDDLFAHALQAFAPVQRGRVTGLSFAQTVNRGCSNQTHSSRRRATVEDGGWLALGDDVAVELTSEDPEWPIEGALADATPPGWRAGAPGPQTIILEWSAPVAIRRILLVFEELVQARTQEFVLRAATGDGEREIVRQQFTFSPPGTTLEREEYTHRAARGKALEVDDRAGHQQPPRRGNTEGMARGLSIRSSGGTLTV